MSMHFEKQPGDPGAYAVIELRTDTALAATLRATRSGVSIDVSEGFKIAALRAGDELANEFHIEIREREL